MTPASNRRWLQFSLRTLLVVVTIFGCWLGYELNWIRQRHEFESRVEIQAFLAPGVSAPGLLRLFNEPGRATVVVDLQEDLEAARRLFPEAEIIALGGARKH